MLKSLDIAGFKSFARPTHLEFPPGITAIVGPNGSGKSNVVDAIRWCLGEQSARELRGARADDVIYAGRKRTLGAAEVSMLLGGTDGTDIEIGRRLFRSGESEYLVNRQRARLRDVVVALAGVGIDAGRHVVVNQGMADALLAAGPQERRGLLEQAAGLSRYREQRDEARQKIAATQSSIETINVVLAEMEPRLTLLRRQARSVAERKDVASRLVERLGLWYASRWSEAIHAIRLAREESSCAQVALDSAREELHEVEARVDDLLARERDVAQVREAAVAALHHSERERDDLQRRRDAAERRIADLTDRLEESLARRANLRMALDRTVAARESTVAALEAIESEIVGAAERRDQALRAVDTLADTASRTAASAEKARESVNESAKRRNAAVEAHRAAARTLEARVADRDRFTDRMVELESHRRTVDSELDHTAGRLRDLEGAAGDTDARAARLRQDHDRCRDRLARIARAMRRSERQIGGARGAIQAAIARGRGAKSAVNSDLLERIAVPPGWERAIAAALGERARAGEMETANPDLECFKRWRGVLGLPGIWADSVVTGVPDALLAGVLLLEHEEEACAAWRLVADTRAHLVGSPTLRIVARSGLVCEAEGTRLPADDGAPELFLHSSADAARLESRVGVLERRMGLLAALEGVETDRLGGVDAELAETEQMLRDRRESISELNGACRSLARQVATVAAELASTRESLDGATADILALTERAADAEEAARLVGKEDAECRSASAEADRAAAEAADALAGARREYDSLSQALAIADERRSHRKEVLGTVDDALARLAADLEDVMAREPDLVAGADRARTETDQSKLALDAVEEKIRDQRSRLDGIPQFADAERPDPRRPRELLSQATARFERAAAHLGRLEDDAARLRADIMVDLGIAPDALPSAGDDIPDESEIRRLKNRVAGRALVDESVVGEYAELNERYTYLHHHLGDLTRAVGELDEILAASDREMETRFGSAFAAVDAEFARVFEIMLRGGRGRLTQTPDGGVDVLAELPGKKSRSTVAYSGGERALVASALLFAVLKIRPTPFCVLDEVDAALDESNVDRYLAVLADISQNTQTIVVTHNRATMSAADVLYGTTLDGEGATNLLSLNLQSYSAS